MYLKINAKFNPLTYDEMVKPLVDYKKAYDEVEDAYTALSVNTDTWKDKLNPSDTPIAFGKWQGYSNDLSDIVEDFSKGMTAQNRSKLLNMKKRYASEIQPIVEADKAMKEANEYRQKIGQDGIFKVSNYTSIDDFMGGKQANNEYISKEALTRKAAALSKAAMDDLAQDPEFQTLYGGQFLNIISHTGGSYEDYLNAISSNPRLNNRFTQVKRQLEAEIGKNNYDAIGQAGIDDAINTGMLAGIDEKSQKLMQNPEYIDASTRLQADLKKKDQRLREMEAMFKNGYLLGSDGKYYYVGKGNGSSGGSSSGGSKNVYEAFTYHIDGKNHDNTNLGRLSESTAKRISGPFIENDFKQYFVDNLTLDANNELAFKESTEGFNTRFRNLNKHDNYNNAVIAERLLEILKMRGIKTEQEAANFLNSYDIRVSSEDVDRDKNEWTSNQIVFERRNGNYQNVGVGLDLYTDTENKWNPYNWNSYEEEE